MRDHDAGEMTAGEMRPPRPLFEWAEWALTTYRESLETALAQAELPKYTLPREQLQKQLEAVLAEQAERERAGSADANA
jgi:hypothetical protein